MSHATGGLFPRIDHPFPDEPDWLAALKRREETLWGPIKNLARNSGAICPIVQRTYRAMRFNGYRAFLQIRYMLWSLIRHTAWWNTTKRTSQSFAKAGAAFGEFLQVLTGRLESLCLDSRFCRRKKSSIFTDFLVPWPTVF
ncbi:MAG TPA: hypothetical protein VII95_18035 [Terriglobales bacterium]|jgi:hypothetical protein